MRAKDPALVRERRSPYTPARSDVPRPITLGGFLEAVRLGEEMTQPQLARKLGTSKPHLNDIEKVVALDFCVRDSGVVVCDRDDD